MKVLVIDAFSAAHLEELKKLGLEVDYRPQLKAEELAQTIGGASIVVARSTKVTGEAIEKADALQLIVRAGAGVNTIDLKAASARAIYVANTPGKNAIAVAELTLGLILAIDRRIPDAVADLRAGKWNKKDYGQADGLFGRTIGIVGLGAIGREVAKRARGFGMKVVGWSRSLDDAKAETLGLRRMASVAELCAQSDVVTVHCAFSADTKELISADAIGRMKKGATFINTSRAELVDLRALDRAIAEKDLRVGLDVFEKEPAGGAGAFEDPIVKHARVIGTHHIGASTEQAQNAVADETVRIIRTFLEGGALSSVVNIAKGSKAACQVVVRHYDRVGVLAEVLGAIRRHDINVEEMENTIFDGAKAASAKIRLSARPSAELVAELSRSEAIIHVEVV